MGHRGLMDDLAASDATGVNCAANYSIGRGTRINNGQHVIGSCTLKRSTTCQRKTILDPDWQNYCDARVEWRDYRRTSGGILETNAGPIIIQVETIIQLDPFNIDPLANKSC